MLNLSPSPKIFLFHKPINMLKSFQGLVSEVQAFFSKEDLLNGAYFVFLNRSRDKMKVLYWDHDGLAIWYKRLEKGTFSQTKESQLNRREFLMLLEGVTPKRMQKRFSLS